MSEPLLRNAGRIGYTFKVDPREVLRASYYDRAFLTAAHNVVQDDLAIKKPPQQPRGG
jgi:hypothetical protein